MGVNLERSTFLLTCKVLVPIKTKILENEIIHNPATSRIYIDVVSIEELFMKNNEIKTILYLSPKAK